jgi:hypothetical protein
VLFSCQTQTCLSLYLKTIIRHMRHSCSKSIYGPVELVQLKMWRALLSIALVRIRLAARLVQKHSGSKIIMTSIGINHG